MEHESAVSEAVGIREDSIAVLLVKNNGINWEIEEAGMNVHVLELFDINALQELIDRILEKKEYK